MTTTDTREAMNLASAALEAQARSFHATADALGGNDGDINVMGSLLDEARRLRSAKAEVDRLIETIDKPSGPRVVIG